MQNSAKHITRRRNALATVTALAVAFGTVGLSAVAEARPKESPDSVVCATIGGSVTVVDMLGGGCPS